MIVSTKCVYSIWFKNGNIINRVNPIKGRCVIFDGDILHASQNPMNWSDRIVINIDLQNE